MLSFLPHRPWVFILRGWFNRKKKDRSAKTRLVIHAPVIPQPWLTIHALPSLFVYPPVEPLCTTHTRRFYHIPFVPFVLFTDILPSNRFVLDLSHLRIATNCLPTPSPLLAIYRTLLMQASHFFYNETGKGGRRVHVDKRYSKQNTTGVKVCQKNAISLLEDIQARQASLVYFVAFFILVRNVKWVSSITPSNTHIKSTNRKE
ncbi:hypothetical protein BKA57DRAFT_198633 [Linnemannia elongata]|nr:hypothetical protein BKA57DRAFT_198633 [Linnemannia elongata]